METILFAIELAALIGGMAFAGKAIYHMYFVVTNTTGRYASIYGPLVLFMPKQFNDIGNRHRLALAPSLLGVAICVVGFTIIEIVKDA